MWSTGVMGRTKVKFGVRLAKKLARYRWKKAETTIAAATGGSTRSGVDKKAGCLHRQPQRPAPSPGPSLPPGVELLDRDDPRFTTYRRAAKSHVCLTAFPRRLTHIYLVHEEEARAGQGERFKKKKQGEKDQERYDQATVDELCLVQTPTLVFLTFASGETELVLAVAAAPCGEEVVAALGGGNQAMMYLFRKKGGVRGKRVIAGKMVMGGYRRVEGNGWTYQNVGVYGPYSFEKSSMYAENSFAAALAAAEARHLMQPLFGSFLKALKLKLVDAGNPPTLEDTPFTTKATSGRGFGSALHHDKFDFGDYSCLAFYATGAKPEALKGGTVYFPHLGLAVQPQGCTAMLLKTTTVYHGTTPSWTDNGDAEYLATALVANENAVKFGALAVRKGGGRLPYELQLGLFRLTNAVMEDERVQKVLRLLPYSK